MKESLQPISPFNWKLKRRAMKSVPPAVAGGCFVRRNRKQLSREIVNPELEAQAAGNEVSTACGSGWVLLFAANGNR
jgi:hypothetical protein